jgi:hypothetical protein
MIRFFVTSFANLFLQAFIEMTTTLWIYLITSDVCCNITFLDKFLLKFTVEIL